jgi:ubiquitin C-terminal hydrolase
MLQTYKNKDKGLSGLVNLGNTCFINACIQILSHTYELNDILDREDLAHKYNRAKKDTVLLVEWNHLRKLLWEENRTVSPQRFIKAIHQIAQLKKMDLFAGFSQNDVSEFFLFLIDCFHNSLAREIVVTITGNPVNQTDQTAVKCFEMIKQRYTKDYSEIWNLFYAIHVSLISKNDTSEIVSSTPEPYFMIDLPIPPDNKSPTLLDCFNYYCKSEPIENYRCEKTNEIIPVERKILFWSFPTILTIDLKRFNSINLHKNQIFISFPLDDLDLSEYVIGYNASMYKYELFGVCNHSGSVHGGHYTAYVKNANGDWYHFNDTNVTKVHNTNTIISTKAYVLFYRRKNLPK